MRMTREFYRPTKAQGYLDLKVRTYEDLPGVEVWTWRNQWLDPGATMFGGKRSKPDENYLYRSDEHRDRAIANYVRGERAHKEAVAKRRASRKGGHPLKVGSILEATWGYDQTNVNYYRVTDLKGKTMVRLVPIGQRYVEQNGPGGDKVVPDPESVLEWDVLLKVDRDDMDKGRWKRARPDGSVSFDHCDAYPTDGSPKYQTDPMFGH